MKNVLDLIISSGVNLNSEVFKKFFNIDDAEVLLWSINEKFIIIRTNDPRFIVHNLMLDFNDRGYINKRLNIYKKQENISVCKHINDIVEIYDIENDCIYTQQ